MGGSKLSNQLIEEPSSCWVGAAKILKCSSRLIEPEGIELKRQENVANVSGNKGLRMWKGYGYLNAEVGPYRSKSQKIGKTVTRRRRV